MDYCNPLWESMRSLIVGTHAFFILPSGFVKLWSFSVSENIARDQGSISVISLRYCNATQV